MLWFVVPQTGEGTTGQTWAKKDAGFVHVRRLVQQNLLDKPVDAPKKFHVGFLFITHRDDAPRRRESSIIPKSNVVFFLFFQIDIHRQPV